jgi:hypothetical protein
MISRLPVIKARRPETDRIVTATISHGRLPRLAGRGAASVMTPNNATTMLTASGGASFEPSTARKAMSHPPARANRMADPGPLDALHRPRLASEVRLSTRSRTPLTLPRDVPPDPRRFLTDRGMGAKVVPEALRAAGFDVVAMQDHYGPAKAQRVADGVWIPDVTQAGMAVLTKDTNMRFNRLVVSAIVDSGERCIAPAGQSLTGRQMA